MFVDEVEVRFEAGKGGDGCVAFHREKFVPLRRARRRRRRRRRQRRSWWPARASIAWPPWPIASSGRPTTASRGSGDNCHGASAKDLVIAVPPGTVVIDAAAGPRAAGPGRSRRPGGRRPGRQRRQGQRPLQVGHQPRAAAIHPRRAGRVAHWLRLELKMIADVGLVGKPNAGKSTLLSRLVAGPARNRPLSRSPPSIPTWAACRSTPTAPSSWPTFPGLIEGAHAGAGLGHEFLRHIERTGILVHLVEPEPADGTDPLANYRAIRAELEQYSDAAGRRAGDRGGDQGRPARRRGGPPASWPKPWAARCC